MAEVKYAISIKDGRLVYATGEVAANPTYFVLHPDTVKAIQKGELSADAVLVYAFHHAAEVWWRGIESKLTRLDRLQVWRIPAEQSQALAQLAERSMQLQATVQDGALTLSSALGSVHLEPLRWK